MPCSGGTFASPAVTWAPFAIAGMGWWTGRDGGEPVTDDHPGDPPCRFTGGTIKGVAVDVSGEPYVDLECEAAALIMRE